MNTNNPNILIVEDEPKVAAFIQNGLIENNFNAEIVYDGLTGKNSILTNKYDLIILDIKLPLLSGFDLCKQVRENGIDTPILMLTAMGSLEDKVKGFEYGADDYLLKPFEFEELLVRIKALLKRAQSKDTNDPIISIADLTIDRNAKSVARSGKKIDLTAKEFALLEFLALNKGKVFSRIELIENVWGLDFDTGTNVVDVYINFLRKKIDSNFTPKLIHTRIGLGYVLKVEED